jgi:hypothetical protein
MQLIGHIVGFSSVIGAWLVGGTTHVVAGSLGVAEKAADASIRAVDTLLYCCCFTAALLLLRCCCFTAALLLLYCCFTAALLCIGGGDAVGDPDGDVGSAD